MNCTNSTRIRVKYDNKLWTGYWAFVAILRRALDDGFPVLDPYWYSQELNRTELYKILNQYLEDEDCEMIDQKKIKPTESAVNTNIICPMVSERVRVWQEAGNILYTKFDGKIEIVINLSDGSINKLIEILIFNFHSFWDVTTCEDGKVVYLLKRVQIFVADLWLADLLQKPFDREIGKSMISQLTAFADYKLPQLLHYIGIAVPKHTLLADIEAKKHLCVHDPRVVALRSACIQVISRMSEIVGVPECMVDFYLWDCFDDVAKEFAYICSMPEHHRTRSTFY